MGVVLPPETAYAKEMSKWEAYPSQYGPGKRPYTFQEFPKRLYLAGRPTTNKIEIIDAQTARDEQEERNLLSRGFCVGQDAAIKAIEKQQTEHGIAAAERNFDIKYGRISDKAAAEVRTAESEVSGHLPEVPRTPIRKRGRPAKQTVSAE